MAVPVQADLEKPDCCRAAGQQHEKHSKIDIQQSCGAVRVLCHLVITVSFVAWMDGWMDRSIQALQNDNDLQTTCTILLLLIAMML